MTVSVQCMNPDCLNEFQLEEEAAQGCSCPSCGGAVVVTGAPASRKSKAGRDSAERASWPAVEPDEETAPVVLALPELCPHCSHEMPARAVLCIRCGYDLRTGKKLTTARSERKNKAILPLRGAWEAALIACGCGGLMLLLLTAVLAGRHPLVAGLVFFFGAVSLVVPCALAFLINAHVTVSQKGDRVLCTTVYKLLQFPIHQRQLVLSPHHRLVWCHETPPEAILFVMVLVCIGIIPGIVWWVLLLRKRSFLKVDDTISGKAYRFSVLWGEQSLRELIDTIQQVIDLQVDRV